MRGSQAVCGLLPSMLCGYIASAPPVDDGFIFSSFLNKTCFLHDSLNEQKSSS